MSSRLQLGFVLLASVASACAAPDSDTDFCDEECSDQITRGFSAEADVLDREEDLRTFLETAGERGAIDGVATTDGQPVQISYVAFRHPDPLAAIILVQGRAESYLKYAELAYDLREWGFSLYMLDLRGQGFSTRLLDDPLLGHVDEFLQYQADLEVFIEEVVLPDEPPAMFGVSHSMGGVVLARHARLHRHASSSPLALDGIVMASPMFRIHLPWPNSENAAYLAAKAGLAESAVWPYDDFTEGYEDNEFTTSRNRYELSINRIENWYPEETRVRAPTNQWLMEAISASRIEREHGREIDTPIRLLQAMDDQIVEAREQDRFCADVDATSACEVIRFEGAKHELFQAPDDIRAGAIVSMINFIGQHL